MQSSRRNNSRRNPLDQFLGQFLPPMGSGSGSGLDATTLRQAMTTLEDSIYQYNRNIREYNENIRQMDHHLYILTQQLRRRTHHHHDNSPAAAFTFSFESPTEAAAAREHPIMTNDELMPLLRMYHYDQERMPTLTHCPITLDLFRQGEDVCEIRGCNHVFKRDPILQWLRRSPVCPVCRYDLRLTATVPAAAAASTAAATSATTSDSSRTNFFRDMFQHLTSSSSTSRDVSGGLMYEFEMPLEMLTQTLQQHFRNTEDDDDLVHHVD